MPEGHLLRKINAVIAPVFAGLHQRLAPYYSATGRPSIDPELMIRMLLIGYCLGIRSERRLCEEVHLNLAYRWVCRLGLNGKVPDHSTFSKNRHGRFRESDLLRRVHLDHIAAFGSGGEAPDHDEEQERRAGPGRGAAKAVPELVSEDFAKPHDAAPASASAVATRRPLAMRLARERAAGRVTELGPGELAFTAAHCEAYLRLARDREPGLVYSGALVAPPGDPFGMP